VPNDILKIIFAMQQQFSSLDKDIYQLYILNRALTAVNDQSLKISSDQKDILLQTIFKVCPPSSQENVNLKFKIINQISNHDLKTAHIKQFIEDVLSCKNLESIKVLKSLTFNNQNDIPKVLKIIIEKIVYLYRKK
jgi:hypothetical protein